MKFKSVFGYDTESGEQYCYLEIDGTKYHKKDLTNMHNMFNPAYISKIVEGDDWVEEGEDDGI